ERTTLLDETLKASRLGASNLRLSPLSLLRQAGDQELAGAPAAKRLPNSTRDQPALLPHRQPILHGQQQDRAALERELQDAVQRSRDMTAKASGAAATPAPDAAAAKPAAPAAG